MWMLEKYQRKSRGEKNASFIKNIIFNAGPSILNIIHSTTRVIFWNICVFCVIYKDVKIKTINKNKDIYL